jgi:hypothetical protein
MDFGCAGHADWMGRASRFRGEEGRAGRGVDGSFACWLRLADAASGGSRVCRRRVDELEMGRLTI